MKPLTEYDTPTRSIHPRALAAFGEEACMAALGVARDLRSGVIPPEKFNQSECCGSACCIAGHIANRMGIDIYSFVRRISFHQFSPLGLFSGNNPSIPARAANAIERYVYDYAQEPWAL